MKRNESNQCDSAERTVSHSALNSKDIPQTKAELKKRLEKNSFRKKTVPFCFQPFVRSFVRLLAGALREPNFDHEKKVNRFMVS